MTDPMTPKLVSVSRTYELPKSDRVLKGLIGKGYLTFRDPSANSKALAFARGRYQLETRLQQKGYVSRFSARISGSIRFTVKNDMPKGVTNPIDGEGSTALMVNDTLRIINEFIEEGLDVDTSNW